MRPVTFLFAALSLSLVSGLSFLDARGNCDNTRGGHGSMIFDSAFSPDSKYLASADESGTLVVWDIASRKMLFRIEDTDTETYGKPIFSPDGKLLAAVATRDGGPLVLLGSSVRFWDAKTGKPLASPTDTFKEIDDLTFSPDSQLLVAQTDFDSTTIWNLSTLKVQKPSLPAAGPYAFDRMGKRLAASADRKSIVIFDRATRRKLRTFTGADYLVSMAFDPTGRTLVAIDELQGADDTSVGTHLKAWNVVTGNRINGFAAVDQHPPVAFSEDGRSVLAFQFEDSFASEPSDSTRYGSLFNISTGRKTKDLSIAAKLNAFASSISPNGRYVAVRASSSVYNTLPEGDILIIDVSAGREYALLNGYAGEVSSLTFSADGQRLVAAYADTCIVAWNPSNGEVVRTLLPEPRGSLDTLAFLPGGNLFTLSGVSRFYDTATGRPVRAPLGGRGIKYYKSVDASGSLIVDAENGKISIYEVPDLKLRYEFQFDIGDEDAAVYALGPRGGRVAIGNKSIVSIFDAAAGKRLNQFTFADGRIDNLSYSPDGKYLAMAISYEKSTTSRWNIVVFEAETGKTIMQFPSEQKDMAFSPDGQAFVLVSLDSKVDLYRIPDGKLMMETEARIRQLKEEAHFAFDPTQTFLAAGTEYGIKIFNAKTGAQVTRLR